MQPFLPFTAMAGSHGLGEISVIRQGNGARAHLTAMEGLRNNVQLTLALAEYCSINGEGIHILRIRGISQARPEQIGESR